MSAVGPLLAFFRRDKDRFPNFEAIELAPTTGWLLLIAVIGAFVFIASHKETWRRILLRVEDPRTLAAFRIVFAAFTIFNVNGLYEHWTYLFTDEGLWTTDMAQELRAKSQFAGFGDGVSDREDWGFFSFAAFLEWLKGPNYSLLMFNSSPTFFWIHITVFEVSMLMLLVGWQTKWIKWVAWFCFHSITMRNTIYWEGTENIYRCWFFYLCLSRCGHAWSVDNWLRCRRLRKAKRLSDRDTAGKGAGAAPSDAHPEGLAAIYRLVPAWPRMLMIMQTAFLYLDTGAVKNGGVWHAGDSFYYSSSLDHFYRMPTTQLGAWFGTTFFRLNSWIVHYWEACFPLILIGLVIRFRWRDEIPALKGRQLALSRIGMFLVVAGFFGASIYAYPVHFKQPDKPDLTAKAVHLWLCVLIAANGLFAFLRFRKADSEARARMWSRLGLGLLGVGLAGVAYYLYVLFGLRPKGSKLHALQIQRWMSIGLVLILALYTQIVRWLQADRRRLLFVLDWFFSRRFWLGLGTIFHVHLIFLMNIGWFTPGALATYVCFFNGREIASIGQQIQRALGRFYKPWASAPEPVPTEDSTLPHHRRDGYALGYAPIFTAAGIVLIGILWWSHTLPDLWEPIGNWTHDRARYDLPAALRAQKPDVHLGWFVLCVGVFLLTVSLRQARDHAFNKWFVPVILLGVASMGLLTRLDLVSLGWSLPVVFGLTWLATSAKTSAPAELSVYRPESKQPRQPWAYGPIGRLIAGSLFCYQVVGISIWLLPDKDSLSTFRVRAQEPFKQWLTSTHTSQSWQMFAPNPPRSNLYMKVLVHDVDGETYDLNTDIYACFDLEPDDPRAKEICDAVYPIPWVWYSRQRKMNRRIVGSEGGGGAWYQKWHARWICREWFMERGHLPEKVELIKVTYPIPSPEYVAKHGAYDPRTQYLEKHNEKSVHTTRCKTTPAGQVPNFIRERHGLETVDESEIKTWKKNRCRRWEKHLQQEAKKRGEEINEDDPRFKVCFDDPKYDVGPTKKATLKTNSAAPTVTPTKGKTTSGPAKAPALKAVKPSDSQR